MGHDNQLIMAVPVSELFKDDYFQGFNDKVDFYSRILKNNIFARRIELESNPNYKQIIPYAVIINNKKIFSFTRANKSYEKRLHGKLSIGVGGHIDLEDKSKDTIRSGLLRELNEELDVKIRKIRKIGYINDDSNSVGKVHFGILFLVEADAKAKGYEILNGRFRDIHEIKDSEGWSSIVLPYISRYL